VTGNPADIGHAGELVLGVDIEDVLDGQGSSEKVTSSGVNDTFWFASGSRGLRSRDWWSERVGE
jgi:Ca2+-binding RTX toxin-like protein